jgi:hypothetical protein
MAGPTESGAASPEIGPAGRAGACGPDVTPRGRVSRWLGVLAIALLAFHFLLAGAMWIEAWHADAMPWQWSEHWREWNHGPWRHVHVARWLFWQAFLLPAYAAGASLLSVIVKPNRRAACVLGLSVVEFFLFLHTHFFLVD